MGYLNTSEAGNSFVRFPVEVLVDKTLSPGAKVLYAGLLSFSWSSPACDPTVQAIADRTCRCINSVRKDMVELVKRKLVEVVSRDGETNLYVVSGGLNMAYCDGSDYYTDESMKMLVDGGLQKMVDTVNVDRVKMKQVDKAQGRDSCVPDPCCDNGAVDAYLAGGTRDPNAELVAEVLAKRKASMPQPKKPVMKFEDLYKEAQRIGQATEAAHERRKKNRQMRAASGPPAEAEERPRRPGELTTRDTRETFIAAMKAKWPSYSVPWGAREASINKMLVEQHGAEEICKVYEHVIENWDDYIDRYPVKGYPSVMAIKGYDCSWIPEVLLGKIEKRTEREKTLAVGEYNEQSAKEHESKYGAIYFFGEEEK